MSETPTIDWAKYGFKELADWPGVYERPEFPLELNVDGEFLRVGFGWKQGDPEIISFDKIPANNQAVVLLLKAFACPKLPE